MHADPKHNEIVLLIHGIRTRAEWHDLVAPILNEDSERRAIPIKYGFFSSIGFWVPFVRLIPTLVVLRKIRHAKTRYAGAKVSVIAHSFGTYAIGHILNNYGDINLHRLVLCGSVLPEKYPWDRIRNGVAEEVVNDYGSNDIFPVLAHALSWGYGSTGTFGFGEPWVNDRSHDFGHSGFFTDEFVRKFWIPWFHEGLLVSSERPGARPYWWSILTTPFFRIPWAGFVIALLVFSWRLAFGIASYDGTLSDYLQARDAVGTSAPSRKEFFDTNAPAEVDWKAFVVSEVNDGYFINPKKSETPKALARFKSGHFKPLIPKGKYISFKGVVYRELSSGIVPIENCRCLKVLPDP